MYTFSADYEGEANVINFAAKTEDECQSWIEALHIASYECLKLQLQSLREQIWAKTGQDPTNTKVIPVKAAEVELLHGAISM